MHQARPILDRCRDRQADWERERERERLRGRERDGHNDFLPPPCVCVCLPILSTKMYRKLLYTTGAARTIACWRYSVLDRRSAALCVQARPSCWLQGFRCIYFIVGAVSQTLWCAFGCPIRGRRWCDVHGRVYGCVGWANKKKTKKKTGESFNISAGLQRTAEGLECFQMALQQNTGSRWQESPSQSAPASNMQARTTEAGRIYSPFPLKEVKARHVRADAEKTRTAWPLVQLIYCWVAHCTEAQSWQNFKKW